MRYLQWLALGLIPPIAISGSASAQNIVPAADGTNTQIVVTGDRVDIQGGTRSGNGTNLFHSFQEFGLTDRQIANFLSQPGIENILGRVIGGNPSVINGVLQVTGGNSNLYLMNPSGIIFGAQAQLNVPGDFVATTATGMGFDNGQWFNAWGEPDYANLIGTPHQFAFDTLQPSALVNAGNLQVREGQSLKLLAGQTVQTGVISAPNGQVAIAAVPGSSLVRISQTEHLLNLEIEPPRTNTGEIAPITALDLPQLLTGQEVETGITVTNSNTLKLAVTETSLPNLSRMNLVAGKIAATEVNILGDRVGLFSAEINASGVTGGGNIRIGGDYRGEGNLPNAQYTFVDNHSVIRADALESGDGGRIIVWADDTTRFFGEISATGIQDGGFVEVSGKKDLIFPDLSTVNVTGQFGQNGTLLLDPENILIVIGTGADDAEITDGTVFASDGSGTFEISAGAIAAGPINIFLAATNNITFTGGTLSFTQNLTLEAGGNVITQDLLLPGIPGVGFLTITAGSNIVADGTLFASEGISLSAGGNISTGDISAVNDDLTLDAGGSISTQDVFSDGNISFSAGGTISTQEVESDADISLTANQGIIVNGFVESNGGGDIILASTGTVQVKGQTTGASSIETNGGSISIAHGGGLIGRPFIVGDASVNGTAGAIRTATSEILPTESFVSSVIRGNITITSVQDYNPCDVFVYCQPFLPLIPLLWDDTPFDIPLDLVADTEADATNEFVEYYELEETPIATIDEIRDQLRTVETQTGIKPAILYLIYGATEVPANPSESVSQSKSIETSNNPFQPRTIWEFNAQGWGTNLELLGQQTPNWQQESDRLELILVTPEAPPIRQVVPNSSRQQVEQLTRRLQRTINQPNRSAAYLSTAQALYNLLIRPISEDLKSLEIEHISFVADAGLRSLPFAALHDGERFIIEDYSVGLMPSVSLTDLRYTNLQTLPVLATGAENFIDQPSLPAVPRELEIIATETRSGQILLNDDFTLANLQAARQVQPYPIVHLATHGEFRAGQPENSFIMLRNEQLALDEIRTLRFYDPLVELFVLSACRTALGDTEAELGFAGLAAASGAKTAIGSLWYVSDLGTLALMAEFYTQLAQMPTRGEALRQAQLALLKGESRFENGVLQTTRSAFTLTPELQDLAAIDLSHPFYWSAFTLIGSPW